MLPPVDVAVRDPARLAALRKLALLDSTTEPAFDRLTRLAIKLLHVPTALVTLVDQDRQFFKSCTGLREPWGSKRETPISLSFCQYAVFQREPFIVENAHEHPLVHDNPAINELGVVAYAGIPLVTSDGYPIGSFCVIDRVPRTWSDDEIALLRDLTSMVMTEIELRSEIAERIRMEHEREQLLAAEQMTRVAAEKAQHRLSFLAEASQALASSLSYETTLTDLVEMAVPALIDRAEIYIVGEHGQLDPVAVAGVEQLGGKLLPAALRARPFDTAWTDHPLLQVLRTKTLAFVPEVSEEYWKTIIQNPDDLTLACGSGVRSLIAVPIQTREHVLGLMVIITMTTGRTLGSEDVELVEDIGRRIAIAVDNARLYNQDLSAIRVRDDMFAIVSHDLRQPVTVIQLYAKIAEQSMNQADHSDDLTKEAVVQIDIAVQKMSKMIEELMDVAALQVDQPLDLERQWTDLVGLARRVVGAYQYSTRAHTLRLVTDEPQIIGFIDENRIDRTIANLVDNAIKYSPTGGGILVQITHEQDEHDTWATLEVQDQGLGIPAQDLPQIFTRFYRASNIPKRINGNGIGLASAQQIVEQHGGTIAVTSCEGEGTTFTVRLPLMRQQP